MEFMAVVIGWVHVCTLMALQLHSTISTEEMWQPCIIRPNELNPLMVNCSSVFRFIETVCEKLSVGEQQLRVSSDRNTASLLMSLVEAFNGGQQQQQPSMPPDEEGNWTAVENILHIKQLTWHRNQVFHGAIQSLFDLLEFWRRQNVAILVDHSLEISPETFQQLLDGALINGQSYAADEDFLEQSIVRIAKRWPHIVVFADAEHTRNIVRLAETYNLFSNEFSSWLFVSTNQSLEHLSTIATPTSQINMLIDQQNSLKQVHDQFTSSSISLRARNQTLFKSLPSICHRLVSNYALKNWTSRISFKLIDQFAQRMATCSQMELYDLFHSSKTLQTEILRIGFWRSDTGLRFHVKFEDINPGGGGGLRGRSLRLDPPYLFIPIKGNVSSITGFLPDIMYTLTEILDFRPEVSISPTNVFGSEVSPGNYDGMVGTLYRREADMAMAVFGMSVKRTPVLYYTAPVIKGDLSIFIRRPPQGASYTAYFETFDGQVWTGVGLTFILTTLAILTVNYHKHRTFFRRPGFDHRKTPMQRRIQSWKDRLQWIVTGMFYEESFQSLPAAATKIVFGVFLLTTLVIFAHYTSTLTSFLIHQNVKMPFETMDDLVYRHPEYKIVLVYGTNHYDRFRTSRTGVFKDVWIRMAKENDSGGFVHHLKDGLDLAYAGKHVFFSDGHSTKFVSENNCSIAYLGARYFKELYFIPARHDFPYNKIFAITLRKFHEIGLLKFLRRKYLPFLEIEACPLKQRSTSLGLVQVVTVYFILICGLISCVIAFIIEAIAHHTIQLI